MSSDPHQDTDVASRHPAIVARLSGALARWWDSVKDGVNEPQRVVIGNAAENPMTLTACEWWNVFVDQQKQVREGVIKNGSWHLRVDRYRFALRRWPADSGLALRDPAAGARSVDFTPELPAGDVDLSEDWLDAGGIPICGAYYVDVLHE